jgi:hypothetical protein
MTPNNEKSLFHFLCGVMAQVQSGETTPEQAHAICETAKEAEKLLKGERDRTRLLMKMDEHEKEFGHRPVLRELASFSFADTTKDPQTGTPRYDKQ